MTLVADSGSTKTAWCLTDGERHELLMTQGINPFQQNEKEIVKLLREELLSSLPLQQNVVQVYFYGAGCTPEKSKVVSDALMHSGLAMSGNFRVDVQSDMLGAARALCGDSEGVACVLGTGSNSCLYNGTEITDQVPSLGYILGDEGSGAALGRRFISDCLKRQLPESVSKEFMERYSLSKDIIIENVYRKPLPNRYIAGFVPFIHEKRAIPEVHKMLVQCFSEFFTRNIINYHKPWLPAHFVGSLAGRHGHSRLHEQRCGHLVSEQTQSSA